MSRERIDAPQGEDPAAPARLNFDVLGEQVGFAAHRAVLVLRRAFAFEVSPVRPVSFNALVLIGANPGVTQSELASALILDKGTAAHLLGNLQKQGWIERAHRTGDRRWKGVYLSPAGVQEVARLKTRIREISLRMSTLFTAEERRHLVEMLNRIVEFGADGLTGK